MTSFFKTAATGKILIHHSKSKIYFNLYFLTTFANIIICNITVSTNHLCIYLQIKIIEEQSNYVFTDVSRYQRRKKQIIKYGIAAHFVKIKIGEK